MEVNFLCKELIPVVYAYIHGLHTVLSSLASSNSPSLSSLPISLCPVPVARRQSRLPGLMWTCEESRIVLHPSRARKVVKSASKGFLQVLGAEVIKWQIQSASAGLTSLFPLIHQALGRKNDLPGITHQIKAKLKRSRV